MLHWISLRIQGGATHWAVFLASLLGLALGAITWRTGSGHAAVDGEGMDAVVESAERRKQDADRVRAGLELRLA